MHSRRLDSSSPPNPPISNPRSATLPKLGGRRAPLQPSSAVIVPSLHCKSRGAFTPITPTNGRARSTQWNPRVIVGLPAGWASFVSFGNGVLPRCLSKYLPPAPFHIKHVLSLTEFGIYALPAFSPITSTVPTWWFVAISHLIRAQDALSLSPSLAAPPLSLSVSARFNCRSMHAAFKL